MENQVMNTRYLNTYYRQGFTFLTSEQIETIRALKGKVSKYKIIGDFHINENRVDNIWENRERQQQIGRETLYGTECQISDFSESTTLNTEIKKRRSKPQTKSVLCNNELHSHISDSISTNNSIAKQVQRGDSQSEEALLYESKIRDSISPKGSCLSEPTEKISSENLAVLYEKKAKRDEKNKANMTRLLASI
ncbi:27769_t:CDS:1 [Gigaspora margarita]|uniref:27769_t:CDS:1 n=1 Tax=Gigaspora margarita TaxID=4874 RepID=A0ABN7WAW2_GIGMA|nr:27769_t:CDS:1 [Gigaspora margarita]